MDPDPNRIGYLLQRVAQTVERYERIPEQLTELIDLGVPYARIQTVTGIPASTAHAWVKRHRAAGEVSET